MRQIQFEGKLEIEAILEDCPKLGTFPSPLANGPPESDSAVVGDDNPTRVRTALISSTLARG